MLCVKSNAFKYFANKRFNPIGAHIGYLKLAITGLFLREFNRNTQGD